MTTPTRHHDGLTSTTVEGAAGTPLAGMTALVTGGGRGLGAAISQRSSRAGARVALTGRNREDLEAWAGTLAHDPVVIPADLTDPDVVSNVLDPVLDQLGHLDVVVNNAGIAHFGPSDQLSAREVDQLLALDTRAPLLLSAASAAHMAAHGGGSFVTISSGVGARGSSRTSLCATSKGALDATTRALAAEWGPRRVRVNGVRVGLVRGESSKAFSDDRALRERYESRVPLRRLAEPEDVAEAVLFLASSSASSITAQVLDLDGGSSTTAPSPADDLAALHSGA